MRTFIAFVFSLFAIGAVQPVAAQESWVRIGSARLAPGAGSITIDTSRARGLSKAVRIGARDGDVAIRRVTITYSGSASRVVSPWFSMRLKAGQQSRPIDRASVGRHVQRVTLEIRPRKGETRWVTLEIWGLQSPASIGSPGQSAARDDAAEPVRRKYRSAKKSARPRAAEEDRAETEAQSEGSRTANETSQPTVRRYEYRRAPGPGEPVGSGGPPSAPDKSVAPPPPATRGLGAPARPIIVPPTPPSDVARSEPAGGSAPPPAKPYTEVDVFFGTDRKREADRTKFERAVAAFGSTRARELTLGKAVVTVPKEGREKGSIPRPEWDLIVTRFALRKEDLARDFTVFSVDVLTQDAFVEQVRAKLRRSRTYKDQAFVFVHGYFVTFDDALFRAAQIAHDLEFDGVPFVYSWPSIAGVTGYVLDRGRAHDARDYLQAFMELVAAKSGAKEVHLIAHSMGADPLLEVLRDMARTAPAVASTDRPRFGEIILAAPDVTRESFETVAARIAPLRRGMTLFASSTDKAMQASRFTRLGESPAGFVPAEGPIVLPGVVDTIDVSSLDTSFFGVNHSTFADREQLIADIRKLMTSSVRPPDRRLPAYQAVSGDRGTYWRFVPQ